MKFKFFERGIVTEEQLKKFSYLSFSQEVREINALLAKLSRKLKLLMKAYFFIDFSSTAVIFLLLVLIPFLLMLPKGQLVGFATFFIAFHLLVLLIRTRKQKNLYLYTKVTGDLLDNLISAIFDDFKLSLGEYLPSYTKIKKETDKIAVAAVAQNEFLRFVKEALGILVGILILFNLTIVTNYEIFKHVLIATVLIFAIFIFYVVVEGIFYIYESGEKKMSASYDQLYKFSHPMLTRTVLDFDEKSYLYKLRPATNLLINKNLVEAVAKSLVPVFLLFLPMLLGDQANGLLILLVGMFMASRLFTLSNPIKNRLIVDAGEESLRKISIYLDSILEHGSEITPNTYKTIKHDYLELNSKASVSDDIIWGDLIIEDMNYRSGRKKNSRHVYVDELILPKGKISVLIGKKDIGKSLFGRLVTLRYMHFDAARISIGNKDIRTFSTLDSGLKYLHYSELRDITTSYRNVLSMYLKQDLMENRFVKDVFSAEIDMSVVKKYFVENARYYASISSLVIPLLDREDLKPTKNDYDRRFSRLVSEIFQNFSPDNPFLEIASHMRKTLGKRVVDRGIIHTAIAEYISYQHLKKFVPEATPSFLNAKLSKSPITKDQRLRFLYAIDTLIEGLVFVVDEPFSNLEVDQAKQVFEDFVEYASTYNAVVLILDEHLHQEIIDQYRDKDCLGKIMHFEDDGFVLKIKSDDFE